MPTVLITGANRGIGLEFTRSFAAQGWRVHACCRNPEAARDLTQLQSAFDGQIAIHRLDVTDGRAVASLSQGLAGEAIDILVNNAGVLGPRTAFGETDYDGWLPVLDVNALGPMRMAEAFVEQLARGERKLIVNISSIMGSISSTNSGGNVIYRSSKAALNMVVKSLAADLASRGITVIAFHPGWVRTDMGGSSASVTPEDSVAGMQSVIARVTAKDTGGYFNYDGDQLPW